MKCLYLAGFSVSVYQSLGPMFDRSLSEIMLSFASFISESTALRPVGVHRSQLLCKSPIIIDKDSLELKTTGAIPCLKLKEIQNYLNPWKR